MEKLSKHFNIKEFEHSNTALRLGIKNQMSLNQIEIVRALCENVLEKVRDHYDSPLIITSGYRSPQLNRKIGGASNSSHMILKTSAAADFYVLGHSNKEVFDWIRKNLEFDQCLLEFGQWVHVSWDTVHNRNQVFNVVREKGITVYKVV